MKICLFFSTKSGHFEPGPPGLFNGLVADMYCRWVDCNPFRPISHNCSERNTYTEEGDDDTEREEEEEKKRKEMQKEREENE
jgi:hypothetical protein